MVVVSVAEKRELRPVRLWISTSVVTNKVNEARSVEGLAFEVLIGCTTWSVHADFEDVRGRSFSRCLVFVEQGPNTDRFGNTRKLVKLWLERLEREGRLIAFVDESDCVAEIATPRLTVTV